MIHTSRKYFHKVFKGHHILKSPLLFVHSFVFSLYNDTYSNCLYPKGVSISLKVFMTVKLKMTWSPQKVMIKCPDKTTLFDFDTAQNCFYFLLHIFTKLTCEKNIGCFKRAWNSVVTARCYDQTIAHTASKTTTVIYIQCAILQTNRKKEKHKPTTCRLNRFLLAQWIIFNSLNCKF